MSTSRVGNIRLVVVGGLAAAALGGCGVGVQTAGHSTKFIESDQRVNFVSKGFTIYDKTGILLAAAGTAGDAYVKQQEARERAVSQAAAMGARPGDTVTYSYTHNVYAPVPGSWTYLSYDWGSGDIDGRDVSYSLFDLRTKLGNWSILGGRGKIGIPLGVIWLSYKADSDGVDFDTEIDHTWIGMPAGVDVGYSLRPDLAVNGRVVIDPIVSPLAGLLGSDWLFLELGGRADYRPLKWLSFYGDAMFRRAPDLGDDDAAKEWQLTAGVALLFGDKKVPDR